MKVAGMLIVESEIDTVASTEIVHDRVRRGKVRPSIRSMVADDGRTIAR
jgi:hypothetical protein